MNSCVYRSLLTGCVCEEGWRSHKGYCYKIYQLTPANASWLQAVKTCAKETVGIAYPMMEPDGETLVCFLLTCLLYLVTSNALPCHDRFFCSEAKPTYIPVEFFYYTLLCFAKSFKFILSYTSLR